MADIIRLKKIHDNKSNSVLYSEGYFGGLFRGKGVYFERNQLRQRFKGRVPDELDIEIREVVHDEDREELDQDLRNRQVTARRVEKKEELGKMQVQGALARFKRDFG
jgi:hypothetical protein